MDILLWCHTKTWQVVVFERLVEVWNLKLHQRTLHTLLNWNLLVCLVLWTDILPVHYFVTEYIRHLEIIGLLVYNSFPNVNVFHYTISKVTFVTVTMDLIRITVEDTSFPNYCLKTWNFITGKNSQLLSLHCQVHLIHFWEKCLSGTQVWIIVVGR